MSTRHVPDCRHLGYIIEHDNGRHARVCVDCGHSDRLADDRDCPRCLMAPPKQEATTCRR